MDSIRVWPYDEVKSMLKQYHHIVGGTFRVVDATVIGVAWLISYWFRFNLPIVEVTKGFPSFETYAALTPLVIVLWVTVFASLRVYESRRMLRRTHEVHALLRAHAFSLLLFIAVTYLFSDYKYSRGVILSFGLIGAFLLVAFRLSLRNLLRAVRKRGYNLRYLLMVGEGPALNAVVYRLDRFPELGLRVIGAVTHEQSKVKEVAGKKVVGHFGQIRELIVSTGADQLIVSLPKHQYSELDRVLGLLKDETLTIQLIPDIHEYVALGCEIEDFDGTPLVNLNDSPLAGWGAVAKRLTDFLVSATVLILFSPLFALIALAIRLTSRGPILYTQDRMGLDGKTFKMYKFRSMRVDAESETGAVWAQAHDQRRTKLGTFLRSTSLDELPQFWNVFKGEMSLVGPRPERPVFVSQFRHQIPNYMLRHKVKAGITGWAQVNGWRGNTALDRRIECDLFYVRHWSYMLDWKILFLTLWKGFIHKNAY
jgi:Undecaprenyl-phosphate glucose phosphotransferase